MLGHVAFLARKPSHNTVKINPRFWECYTCFGYATTMGVGRISVIFQDRPMFGHIIQKVSAESFSLMWLNTGLR